MTPPRWFRVWTVRLGASLAGLFITIILLTGLESIAYVMLSTTNGDLSRRTTRRHALLGTGEKRPGVLSFYPLWGWGGGSPRSRSALQKLNLRAKFGFVPNRPGQSTALDRESDVRIFVLGGSTVRGYPHPVDQSIPAHMERMLERSHEKNFNVVNAGFGGWTNVNELSFLVHKIIPFFDPDAVVILDGANDAGLAVMDGTETPRDRSSHSLLDPLTHPRLKQYDRQLRSINDRPAFVLNQLLNTLGVSQYLSADRYYAGTLVRYWWGYESPSYRHEMKNHWRRYRLPSNLQKRLQKRLHANPGLRQLLRHSPLPDWQKNRVRRVIAGWNEERWQKNRSMLERASTEKLEELQELFPYTLPYDRIDSLPCRRVPLSVQPYLDRVRIVRNLAKKHSFKLLYTLQPTLVFKQTKTPWEEQIVAANVTKSLFAAGQYFTVHRGLCIHSVYRRFFRRAADGFRNIQGPKSSGIQLIDLSRRFESDPGRRFSDFVHYTEKSHRIIAGELVDHLSSMHDW